MQQAQRRQALQVMENRKLVLWDKNHNRNALWLFALYFNSHKDQVATRTSELELPSPPW